MRPSSEHVDDASMKKNSRVLCLSGLLCCLSACGGSDDTKPSQPTKSDAAKPSSQQPDSLLAKPVTAPIKARDRLLHDFKKQQDKAKQRRADMEKIFDR